LETSHDVSSLDCNIFGSLVGHVAQDREDFGASRGVAIQLYESLEQGTVIIVRQRGQSAQRCELDTFVQARGPIIERL